MNEILRAFAEVQPLSVIAGDTSPIIYFDVETEHLSSMTAYVVLANKDTPQIQHGERISCSRTVTGFQCMFTSEITETMNGSYWYYLVIHNSDSGQEFRRCRGSLEVCAAPKTAGGGTT
ncbi:MAG: hypothetical protein J5851_07650 [Oscillospiraceae bacterium]|nr:hypothetical protein [Oscillospiraceae bacterium]